MFKLVLEFNYPLTEEEKTLIENTVRTYGGVNPETDGNSMITTGAYIEVHKILEVAETMNMKSAKYFVLH